MFIPYAKSLRKESITLRGGGIDLRAEMEELFGGTWRDLPISRYGIARLAKLDASGKPILCTCLGSIDKTPDPTCTRCNGEGHLWKEYWIRYYKVMVSGRDALSLKKRHTEFGLVDVPFMLFYLTYDSVKPARSMEKFDRLIEVKTDLEGNVVTPIERTEFWDINIVQAFSNRRTEYWRIACRNESLWTDADYQT